MKMTKEHKRKMKAFLTAYETVMDEVDEREQDEDEKAYYAQFPKQTMKHRVNWYLKQDRATEQIQLEYLPFILDLYEELISGS